jgi:hypothetical protein
MSENFVTFKVFISTETDEQEISVDFVIKNKKMKKCNNKN